jgi:hypothetical protein
MRLGVPARHLVTVERCSRLRRRLGYKGGSLLWSARFPVICDSVLQAIEHDVVVVFHGPIDYCDIINE